MVSSRENCPSSWGADRSPTVVACEVDRVGAGCHGIKVRSQRDASIVAHVPIAKVISHCVDDVW